jgi:hypothetical protein
MALQPSVGPWPLLQFRNHFFFTETVGLVARMINPSQGRYLHTGQDKHRINAHTDIHALRGIRTHNPSVRASEDSSCLRPRSHYDRYDTNLLTGRAIAQAVSRRLFTAAALVQTPVWSCGIL